MTLLGRACELATGSQLSGKGRYIIPTYITLCCPGAQALSASQAYIFEERQRLLQLQAENEELRLAEAEDQRRIRRLLAALHPHKPHITLAHQQQHQQHKAGSPLQSQSPALRPASPDRRPDTYAQGEILCNPLFDIHHPHTM